MLLFLRYNLIIILALIMLIILIHKTHKNLLISHYKYSKYTVHHESIRTFIKFVNMNKFMYNN